MQPILFDSWQLPGVPGMNSEHIARFCTWVLLDMAWKPPPKNIHKGSGNSMVGRALALRVASPGLIPSTRYGSLSPPIVAPECGARSYHWVVPGTPYPSKSHEGLKGREFLFGCVLKGMGPIPGSARDCSVRWCYSWLYWGAVWFKGKRTVCRGFAFFRRCVVQSFPISVPSKGGGNGYFSVWELNGVALWGLGAKAAKTFLHELIWTSH